MRGDEFGFSFWAKGVSIPVTGICRAQVLLIQRGSIEADKNGELHDRHIWIHAEDVELHFAASAYTKVIIKLTYAKATGTIYFDGLSLMKAP